MEKDAKTDGEGLVAMRQDTGEILCALLPLKRPNLRREIDFFMGDTSFVSKLAKDKEIRGQPLSILLYMLSILKDGNYLVVSQKKIAKELDMDPVRVSVAIKKLVEKKIIDKDIQSGVRGAYVLNPQYFWRGTREQSEKNYNANKSKEASA